MPLVAHSDLPVFAQLRDRGHEILTLDRALNQDIRELHIGFLNMMPDAALQATERQFIRLVGGCNRIAQLYVYPFSLPGLSRGATAQTYIERYYSRFENLQSEGLDAMIITGANVANPALNQEPFWDSLVDVVNWAQQNVTSTLCSCLATHALLKLFHGIEREPLPQKCWGVYSHRVATRDHPLTRNINTRFDAPHSRYNDIPREKLEAAGLTVLAVSDEADVHMAVSPDQFRVVYFQGHPEYDRASLLKEYKRELLLYLAGALNEPPAMPEHYFSDEAVKIIDKHLAVAEKSVDSRASAFESMEREIEPMLDNTWGDTAAAIVNNWLGLVYKLTDLDRTKQFVPGTDPNDPLGIRPSGA